MYQKIRPLLFRFDPENMHALAEKAFIAAGALPLVLESIAKRFCVVSEALSQEVCGLRFYNPVGLGAGFDKNATMTKPLAALGFGFIELGTITPKPQSGNPKPRIFRHIEDLSLQNAMGFNNDGAKKVRERVGRIYPFVLPLGISLGKNKLTEDDRALFDYQRALSQFRDAGDYFAVNISSPNTPNLRDLQNEDFVRALFSGLCAQTKKPIFLKISPDMGTDAMLGVCEAALNCGASGIIATNTTTNYGLVRGAKDFGGLSGNALKRLSREKFEILARHFFKKTTLISVGGIDDGDEAYERIRLGASLVQIYTSMIFYGPSVVREINARLLERLNEDGFKNIAEARGVSLH